MRRSVSSCLRGLAIVSVALVGASCSSTPPKATAPSYELLITNAQIVDGTGGAARKGSIGIRGGKIAAVGEVTGTATRTIDA
jgi:urease alpha subunit